MKANYNPCVKTSFQATHADITTGNGYLNIVGCPSLYIPGSVHSILPSLVATPYVIKITPSTTAANSNSFMIVQFNKTLGVYQDYIYVGDNIPAGATAATEIDKIQQWVANVNKANGHGSLGATATDATTYVTIQGTTADPLFTFTNLGNATIIDTTNAMLLAVTIASNTTADPTVFTASAAHGLTVGMTVTITTSDATKFVAGTYRVASVPLATTFTLTSRDGATTLAGTSTATGTITKVAQEARGTATQVTDSGTANQPLTGDAVISADTYATVVVNGAAPDGEVLTDARRTGYTQTLYFDEAGANYAAFLAQLRLSLARQLTAGVVDPGLVS